MSENVQPKTPRTATRSSTTGRLAAKPSTTGRSLLYTVGKSAHGKSLGKDILTLKFAEIYSAQPTERIDLVRAGVPAKYVILISDSMGVTKERLFRTLRFPRATVDRKVAKDEPLPADQGERILGLARLVGQAQAIVAESGNSKGFDAAKWVANWMEQPVPALGGQPPASFLDTSEGLDLVSNLLAKMQSGAYA